MATAHPDDAAGAFAATLAARGLNETRGIALDATITPPTMLGAPARLAASLPGAASGLTAPQGSLPPISLSFPVTGGDAVAPAGDRELEVVSLLGEGGMGSVYLARQRSLERDVAVKTTRDMTSAEAREALCAEAVITGHLEHPGIVPIHQLARAPDGRPILVMKRIEGSSWRELLADAGHPSWKRLRVRDGARRAFHLEVLGRVCEALAFAHDRGFVHRDVKPDNVMVGAFGEVYLVDWGIAVRAGPCGPGERVAGTPIYMAPEMVLGGGVDARTDVYLLGATLHEVLTGLPPQRGATLCEVLRAAVASEPPRFGPEVPTDLAALCRRAMSKDPADRPRDASTFRDALADHQRHRASRALVARADERLEELRQRTSGPIAEGDRPLLYRLVSECRFGYLEAQREWAENEAVPSGLQATLGAAVEIELSRGDAAAARALLAELPTRDEAFEARVARLEEDKEKERLEARRLQLLAEGTDSSAQPWLRVSFAAIALALTIGVTLYASRQVTERGGITLEEMFVFSLLTAGMLIAAFLTLGRRLLTHAFNRRFVIWALIAAPALIVNRAVGLGSGISPRSLLVHDMVLISACFAFGALTSFRLLALPAAMMFGGAILATQLPGQVESIFGAACIASLAVLGVVLLRARRRPPAGS